MNFARMKWGMICSIEDPEQMREFKEFGKWMVKELEAAAQRLHLGHCFTPISSFAMYASPGSVGDIANCYEQIRILYPEVSYVIHVLPSKDSLEFQLLKEMTSAGALIGQGVLAENALNHFKCYQLGDVMYNMNQWIARRLSQIMARRNENAKSNRKESYQMLVTNNNVEHGSAATKFYRQIRKDPTNSQQQQFVRPKNWLKPQNPTMQDMEYSVEVVLHAGKLSDQFDFTKPPPSSYQQSPTQKNDRQQQENSSEREVIVRGFPMDFNKFQIASLFPDFRPHHVEYRSIGEAVVQFGNKYHAEQVVLNYHGRYFEDEDFTLEVSSMGNTERKVLQEKLNQLQAGGSMCEG